MGIFTRVAKTNISSSTASYKVALELAKYKKLFSDRLLVKKCVVQMAKAFGDTKMAEKFKTAFILYSSKESGSYEWTCGREVTQLLIFVCTVQSDFSAQEELNLCSLKGATMWVGIYEAVKTTVDKFSGFDMCSCKLWMEPRQWLVTSLDCQDF
jgi:hypothetical protein